MLRSSRRARRQYRQRQRKTRQLGSYTPDRPLKAASEDYPDLPICKCGKVVKYAGLHICEDCFVNAQIRWPGVVTRVRINF